jgi:hypothetical protein
MMPHIYLAHQMAGNLASRRPDWLRSDRRLKLVHAFPDYACLSPVFIEESAVAISCSGRQANWKL